jgi:hypothetical protein
MTRPQREMSCQLLCRDEAPPPQTARWSGAASATVFGLTEHGSAWWVLAAPIFVWELSLGLYLVVKGFKPSPAGTVSTPSAHAHVGD